ncbi:uncharacterized protein LOC110713223 [Chenopodium quinoa]|uniref:uncharacterized protein LOC110713223 n=1 Tax=Chenopodium quinoa TaxID=63459 RepID=UPI000B78BCF9|nr:uncharacterized protein LOC110713223 [Chenopodium quinoa]
MLRKGVTTEQRDSIRGVGSMNLEAILALLAEAMLRVNGLNKPFNEKTKEVRAANLRAASNLNRVQYDVNKNELLTRDILYSQAAANLQVKKDLEAAQQKVAKLKGELKTTKAELDKLQNIDRDTTSLRRQVENL